MAKYFPNSLFDTSSVPPSFFVNVCSEEAMGNKIEGSRDHRLSLAGEKFYALEPRSKL